MSTISEEILLNVLELADTDVNFRSALDANPWLVYTNMGFNIPQQNQADFNQLFIQGVAPFFGARFNRAQFKKAPNFKCAACRVAAYAACVTIIGLGHAAVAGLSGTSPIIMGLAPLLGLFSAGACASLAAFIQGIWTTVAGSVALLVKEVCKYAGICP